MYMCAYKLGEGAQMPSPCPNKTFLPPPLQNNTNDLVYHHIIINAGIICIIFFLISFPFVLGNGLYLFGLFDQFAGTIPLLLVGFAEFIAIAWVYGVNRYIRISLSLSLLHTSSINAFSLSHHRAPFPPSQTHATV